MIPVTNATTIYLKVFPPSGDPPAVLDHDVPILTIAKEDIDLTDWDLTTQQVNFTCLNNKSKCVVNDCKFILRRS